MAGDKSCALCNQPSELKCSACKLVSYCGKEHQKEHWKTHKSACRAYEVQSSPKLGKHLVASRDLAPGDLILTEAPLVFGPRPHVVEEGPVPCPGCCRLIIGEKSPRCEGCDFPICDPQCEGVVNPEKHGGECLVLGLRDVKAINGLHDFYRQDALLALRCLLLQRKSLKKFKQLMDMEGHMEKRGEDTDIYKEVEERVVEYLHENFLSHLKNLELQTRTVVLPETSKETIRKICGIIDVNALEINQGCEISAIFPTAYLMEHNCVSNTAHVFGNQLENYKITLRAALPIKKGEHITTMYTHALWGTQARREHLRETKYFECECTRCSDPTELGTHLSALRCLGSDGVKCDGIQLPLEPTDDKTEWACSQCQVRLANSEVAALINQIGDEVDQVQLASPTVRDLDGLMNKVLTFLHPNHYHVYAIKHSLIQLYGYQQGYMPNQISDELLKIKTKMCRELLEVTRKIDPGNARLALYTGVILHELYLADMCFVKRKWDVGIKSDLIKLIRESENSLKDAKEALKYETYSPAGEKLLKLVEDSTKEFYKWIERYKVKITDA